MRYEYVLTLNVIVDLREVGLSLKLDLMGDYYCDQTNLTTRRP
jgi:hypothetical protein